MTGKYALVIGNTEHVDAGLAKLTAPGKDTEDFARILRDANCCGFDTVNILLDQPSSTVIEAIDEFFDQKLPGDLLLLYFSGHGVRDEFGSLYLAVRNTVRSRLRSTAIKADYIREAMDESRSKRQVVILDCCNSGAFPQGAKAEVGGTMGLTRTFQGYGRFVLTASDATQYAWEGDRVIGETQNSLFTHFLVKGLKGEADDNGDGRITVDELYDYAYNQIAEVMPNQTPTKSTSKQEGEIILRDNMRLEEIRAVPLPDDLLDEIDDPRPYVREVAVQKLDKILKGKNKAMARSALDALEKIASDENSTRRIAQAATDMLAAYRQRIAENPKTEADKQDAVQSTVSAAPTPIAEENARVKVKEQGATPVPLTAPPALVINDAQPASKAVVAPPRKTAAAQPTRKNPTLMWTIIGLIGCCGLAFAAWSTGTLMNWFNPSVPTSDSPSRSTSTPRPPTPRPSPTSTSIPTLPATTMPILLPDFNTFLETFGENANGWSEAEVDGEFFIGGSRLEDGMFIIESTETKKTFFAKRTWTGQEPIKDFNVSVDARLLEGGDTEICYGIAFRENTHGFYAFVVCDSQSYRVEHYNAETTQWTDLQDWESSDAIRPGDWNTLSIMARGDTFTFYINNQEVTQITDQIETEGKLILVMDVLDTVPGAVGYDNLAVQQVFYDSFATSDNPWTQAEHDNEFFIGETRVQDGIYVIESTETKQPVIARRGWTGQEAVGNFNVSVSARLLEGDADNVCYGLAFRESEQGYYAFVACDNQSFRVRHYNAQASEWTELLDWTSSALIRPGDWNTLGVTAIDDTFTFYINNEKVDQITDQTETEGEFDVVLYIRESIPGSVGFDDFTLVSGD